MFNIQYVANVNMVEAPVASPEEVWGNRREWDRGTVYLHIRDDAEWIYVGGDRERLPSSLSNQLCCFYLLASNNNVFIFHASDFSNALILLVLNAVYLPQQVSTVEIHPEDKVCGNLWKPIKKCEKS